MIIIFRSFFLIIPLALFIYVVNFTEKYEKVNNYIEILFEDNISIQKKLVKVTKELEGLNDDRFTDSIKQTRINSTNNVESIKNISPDYGLIARLISDEIDIQLERALENQKEKDYLKKGIKNLYAEKKELGHVMIDEPSFTQEEIEELVRIDDAQTEKYKKTRSWLDNYIVSRKDQNNFDLNTAVEYIENSGVQEIQKYALIEELNTYIRSMPPETGGDNM